MLCWKLLSQQAGANPEGLPSSLCSLLRLLALYSFFEYLLSICVGTGLLSWHLSVEQIEKRWASAGGIKLFFIFIWLRATCTFPLLCLSPLSKGYYNRYFLSPSMPDYSLSTHLTFRTLQTIPLSLHNHCKYSEPPSPNQLPQALGIFSYVSMISIGPCARSCILRDCQHHGGSWSAETIFKVVL